ncbi:hypothetical protein B0H17DRAFT_316165 [Mycena rosella]|uniref:Uncharacterized protein n=1 Tax=Mycena rosella TaxID=1033263 RepID=A0AAD7DV33_MYCRO|nr:hypothetical protein B0H17DRAFT_316165 [Mycena rosella]
MTSASDAPALVTVTQAGIFVQNTVGLYYSDTQQYFYGGAIPIVETCGFSFGNAVGAAGCAVNNAFGSTMTISASKTPFFIYTAALPTSTRNSLTGHSGDGSSSSNIPSTLGSPSLPASITGEATGEATNQVPGSTAHKVPVGAIVGPILAILAAVGGLLAFLLWRRRRRQRYPLQREKNELDPEPADSAGSFSILLTPFTHDESAYSSAQNLLASPAGGQATISGATPTTQSSSETHGERRKRLRQMQETVQQLQQNVSAADTVPDAESQVASQQRQIDMLLGEVGRLRAIVEREEALPAYQE